MKRIWWPGLAILLCFGFSAQPEKGFGTLVLSINPQFAGQPLVLGEQLYYTSRGDSLYVDVFRYYLSSVQLLGKPVDYQEDNTCHLVDAEDSSSQTIVLKNVPAGRYASLVFYVGTDSLANVSGAMGGDLDPTLGMYWAWNSGYINVKIEGRSNACNTLHHAFTFHIGGYMPPHQTLRRVELPLNKLKIRAGETTSVRVNADLEQFFSSIELKNRNQLMIPGKEAARLADGFTEVFGW